MAEKNQRKRRKSIVISQFPSQTSTEAILELLSDGNFHKSKALPDRPPFSEFVSVSKEEMSDYTEVDGTPDFESQERYKKKKRKMVFEQFHALNSLGFVKIKNKTTDAAYALSDFGQVMLDGIKIVQAAHRRGISTEKLWNILFDTVNDSQKTSA